MEGMAARQGDGSFGNRSRVNVLRLHCGIHQRPVVVERISTQQADCGVVAAVGHVPFFAIAHRRGHPVGAHFGAIARQHAEVETKEEEKPPVVCYPVSQAQHLRQLEKVEEDEEVPTETCRIAYPEGVKKEGVDKPRRLVGDGTTCRLVHDV